jgi:hypothetical protein
MRIKILIALILLFPVLAMAEYRVTWVWRESVLTSCPQSEPTADEFGRISQSLITIAVACFDNILHPKERIFNTFSEAIEFMKRGQKESDLHNFVLELIEE